jgi:hypothetical protein
MLDNKTLPQKLNLHYPASHILLNIRDTGEAYLCYFFWLTYNPLLFQTPNKSSLHIPKVSR